MADQAGPKKFDRGETQGSFTFEDFTTDTIFILFTVFIIGALLGRLALVFGGTTEGGLMSVFGLDRFALWFQESAYPVVAWIAALLSALFLWGIIHAVKKLTVINKAEHAKYHPNLVKEAPLTIFSGASRKPNYGKKWTDVLSHASSHNVNDWKIAILNADNLLDEVLIEKSYQGESMGDRLKAVNRADLKTLDLAWEAHKYRNRLAHGDAVEFNQHEVRRIISHFEKVFKEFGLIS